MLSLIASARKVKLAYQKGELVGSVRQIALLVLIRFVEEPFHLFLHLFDSARRIKAMYFHHFFQLLKREHGESKLGDDDFLLTEDHVAWSCRNFVISHVPAVRVIKSQTVHNEGS